MASKQLVRSTTSHESYACPAVFRASPALVSRLRHSCRCLSTIFGCHVSTFLHPVAPPALPGFVATMSALTPAWRRDPAACSAPCGGRYLGILSPSCTTQVSLLHVFCPSRAFRLQPPCCPPMTALSPNPSASWDSRSRVEASPLVGRLASQHGRIEFAFATDDSVRLPLLSTPPHGDAVTVSYRPE